MPKQNRQRKMESLNPILLDFNRSLKKYGLKGEFNLHYDIEEKHNMGYSFYGLNPPKNLLNVGRISIRENLQIVENIRTISDSIVPRNYGDFKMPKKIKTFGISRFISAYCKYYFSNKRPKSTKSPLFYGFLFGGLSVFIGLNAIIFLTYILINEFMATMLCISLFVAFLMFHVVCSNLFDKL